MGGKVPLSLPGDTFGSDGDVGNYTHARRGINAHCERGKIRVSELYSVRTDSPRFLNFKMSDADMLRFHILRVR